ncbi:MAG: diacylglycerol kinase [Candidatus Eremiobacteraeota bacterium]|nr:diacylglycerol kinase [Candidatus Eremiobacteraeota bacterium]
MRIQLFIAAAVLLATLYLRLERVYVVETIILIAIVLSLELVNTAVEAIVDLLTVAHHPLAKIAKDAAAGAVLVASIAGVVVGYLVFYEGLFAGGQRVYNALAQVPVNTVFISLAIVAIAVVIAKALSGRGSAFQGGAVSGHAALAFAMATILALFYQRPLLALLAFALAFLVAQSRVEAGIHSAMEVAWGAILGIGVSLAIYILIRPHVL